MNVCADGAVLSVYVAWLHVFPDLHAQQPRDLKTRERGKHWGRRAWVTYHLMLPVLHNPLLSTGVKMLRKPRSRTMGDRKRAETALSFAVSVWIPDRASIPFFTKLCVFQLCILTRSAFCGKTFKRFKDRFEPPSKQSAIVFFVKAKLCCASIKGDPLRSSLDLL